MKHVNKSLLKYAISDKKRKKKKEKEKTINTRKQVKKKSNEHVTRIALKV